MSSLAVTTGLHINSCCFIIVPPTIMQQEFMCRYGRIKKNKIYIRINTLVVRFLVILLLSESLYISVYFCKIDLIFYVVNYFFICNIAHLTHLITRSKCNKHVLNACVMLEIGMLLFTLKILGAPIFTQTT